jgi:hypothetical protein
MAIRGLTLSSVKRYISPLDPAYKHPPETKPEYDVPEIVQDESLCTVAVLRPLDVFASTYVGDSTLDTSGGQLAINMNRSYLETVRFGLSDLLNFEDEHGDVVKFETVSRQIAGRAYNVVTDAVLAKVPPFLVREWANEIRALSTVTADEAKN